MRQVLVGTVLLNHPPDFRKKLLDLRGFNILVIDGLVWILVLFVAWVRSF